MYYHGLRFVLDWLLDRDGLLLPASSMGLWRMRLSTWRGGGWPAAQVSRYTLRKDWPGINMSRRGHTKRIVSVEKVMTAWSNKSPWSSPGTGRVMNERNGFDPCNRVLRLVCWFKRTKWVVYIDIFLRPHSILSELLNCNSHEILNLRWRCIHRLEWNVVDEVKLRWMFIGEGAVSYGLHPRGGVPSVTRDGNSALVPNRNSYRTCTMYKDTAFVGDNVSQPAVVI
jgi:hypothetical protein